MSAAEIITIITTISTSIIAIIAAIASLVTSFKVQGIKTDATISEIQRTEARKRTDEKLESIHSVTNSNITEMAKNLALANQKIELLQKLMLETATKNPASTETPKVMLVSPSTPALAPAPAVVPVAEQASVATSTSKLP